MDPKQPGFLWQLNVTEKVKVAVLELVLPAQLHMQLQFNHNILIIIAQASKYKNPNTTCFVLANTDIKMDGVQGCRGFSKLHWLKLESGAENLRHTSNQQSTLK